MVNEGKLFSETLLGTTVLGIMRDAIFNRLFPHIVHGQVLTLVHKEYAGQ